MKKPLDNNSLSVGIIALVNPPIVNGLSQYIVNLFKALTSQNSKHKFFLITNREFYSFFKDHLNEGEIVIVDIPHNPRFIMRPVYFFWQNFFAERFLKKMNLDVCHIPNAVPILKNFEISLVTTIHDLAEFNGFRHSGFHRWFRKWVTKTSALRSDHILTVSDFSKQEILRHLKIDASKVSVTYPGNTFRATPLEKRPGKIPQNEFLFLSGKGTNKNTETLISSFREFNSDGLYKLNVVGKLDKKYLSKDVVSHGVLNSKSLQKLYTRSIALLYPSLYEGFGFPILEAMSSGVPVIASNKSSMPEVAGNAAIYVNPEDSKDIIAAMKKISESLTLRTEKIKLGYKKLEEFDWAKTAKMTIHSYESICRV